LPSHPDRLCHRIQDRGSRFCDAITIDEVGDDELVAIGQAAPGAWARDRDPGTKNAFERLPFPTGG